MEQHAGIVFNSLWKRRKKKSNDRKKTVVSSKNSQNMGKLRWVEDQNQSYLCDTRKQDNQNTPTKRLV